MLSMTKQRKTESGETVSVVKAQEEVTICPYLNFAEGIVLTRITTRVIII